MSTIISLIVLRLIVAAQIALLAVSASAQPLAQNGTQVVVVAVANMYSHPSDKSDVVSQAIYGSNVKLLLAKGEWSRIQTSDGYKGWVRSRQLRIILNGDGYATSGQIVQVNSLFASIYNEPDVTRHKPVITVPFETRLEVASAEEDKHQVTAAKKPDHTPNDHKPNGQNKAATKTPAPLSTEGWLHLWLPERRNGWIQQGDVIPDPKPMTIPESIELGKRFLGLPYLWAGRSSFGFDCSGFTQMLVRARGINMPRDADQQAAWSGVAPVQRKDLKPGDLLFFGSSPKDITHTGMYIGEGEFIHDALHGHPVVQIGKLDDDPWTKLLVACRRVKTGISEVK